MGIKHYFNGFLKKNHPECISTIKRGNNEETSIPIDVLLVDMNGIIHNAAQEVYGYGNFSIPHKYPNDQTVYKYVNNCLDSLVVQFKPKELVLCIDGVAPMSKQIQQRQRRFRAAYERDEKNVGEFYTQNQPEPVLRFDSNAISPGTEFMHKLGRSIALHIERQQKGEKRRYEQDWRKTDESENHWKNLKVYFANDKVEGEGEHKLVDHVRKNGRHDYNYCIYGSDADLIMLSMALLTTSAITNIFVLRDKWSPTGKSSHYLFIDIPLLVSKMSEEIEQEFTKTGDPFDKNLFIVDFIFLCFMVGNDFLPNIPMIEIMSNGIGTILQIYTKFKKHITQRIPNIGGGFVYNQNVLMPILQELANTEQFLCNEQANDETRFPDRILNHCSSVSPTGYKVVDIAQFRKEYTRSHFIKNGIDESLDAAILYLEGMQWVLSYYTKKVPSWSWSFPYDYAPNLTSIIEAINFKRKPKPIQRLREPRFSNLVEEGRAIPPFHQLLCILPPQSSNLLPYPLNNVFFNELKVFAPEKLTIDLSGKHQEWEGIVLLPKLDQDAVKKCYWKYRPFINHKADISRDKAGRTFVYQNGSYTLI